MGYETVAEMPPAFLLAFVLFGTFMALAIYHVLFHDKELPKRGRLFAWICMGIMWGGSGLAILTALP